MYNNFIFLVGLPGSGKTKYGESIHIENSAFIDDIRDFNALVDAAHTFKCVIAADPNLCDDDIRKLATARLTNLYPYAKIDWLFWENSVDKAWANVNRRNDGRIISRYSIELLSKKYNPPKVDFKIWTPDG